MRELSSIALVESTKPVIRAARWCALACAAALSACVPADEAIGLGSVQFTFRASPMTQEGIQESETVDRWSIDFDRIVLGFKTMTIGQVGVADVCSYRGRGAATDVVFDPRLGVVQTFNGLQPVQCPDVGIIFGPPWDTTTLGDGATSQDLVELGTGRPAHAIVEATANRRRFSGSGPTTLRIALRFDTDLTSSRFGGCRAAARGIRILEGERDQVSVRFAAERLFAEAISTNARLRVAPFAVADREGNDDGIVTMDELDSLPLWELGVVGEFYQLPDGSRAGSFGDFVRVLFRFTIMFRNDDGLCVGNEPGSEEGGQVSP